MQPDSGSGPNPPSPPIEMENKDIRTEQVEDVGDDDLNVKPNAVDGVGGENTLAALSGQGIVKSPLDDIPRLKAVWVFRHSFAYCMLVTTNYIWEGFVTGVAGAIIANKGFIDQFGSMNDKGKMAINTSWISAWGAIINVGQIIAMAYVWHLADKFGRKWAFYHIWIVLVGSMFCLTFATEPGVWFLGKLLFGIGIGSSQSVTTPYVMEIAPNRIRGAIVAVGMIWQTVGGLVISVMLEVTNRKYPTYYHLPIYVMWGPVICLLIFYLILPESPWYYARHGKKEQCLKSMKRLYASVPGYDEELEYGILLRNLDHESRQRGEAAGMTFADVFRGLNRKRLITMAVLCCSQQLGGLALVGTYGTYFFQQVGLANPFLASVIQNCIGLAANVVYVIIIDKIGRRWPICLGYTGISILAWIIGGCYYIGGDTANRALVAFMSLMSLCNAFFAHPYFLIASELPTARMRMKLNAVAWITQALLGIATSFAVPPLITHIGMRAGFFFGVTSMPCCAFLWYSIPETKGRSVAEIDELYERHVPAWRWARFKTQAEIQMRAAVESGAATGTRGSQV